MAERNPTAAEAAELERLRAKLEREGKVKPVDHENAASQQGRTGPSKKS